MKICEKCGEPIQKVVNLFGVDRVVPIVCRCRKEEIKRCEEIEKNREKQERLKILFTNSLMDKKFRKETFESWDFTKGSKKMYQIGIKYCNNFKEVKENGLGFLVYGSPGNGKTYFSNSIANRLLTSYVPVIAVGINGLLQRIQQTYNTWGKEGESTVLQSLSNADLLVIDDLGTEQDTDWSKSKIYNIIDSRYRNGLPIIVSTNYSITELKEKYDVRTMDRLLEMCTPLQFNGESIRVKKARDKTELLREIIKS